jgi:hypothetical protein
LVFLKRLRGEPASFGDVFAGFSGSFPQLMLAGFLTKLLTMIGLCCCLILPGIYLLVAWVLSVPLVADKRLEFWSAMELSRKVVTRVWFQMFALMIVVFIPIILMNGFIQVKLTTMLLPIMQEAMTSGSPDMRRIMDMFQQIVRVSLPLNLLFKVVLLLNLPFALAALSNAYESLFGTRTTPSA